MIKCSTYGWLAASAAALVADPSFAQIPSARSVPGARAKLVAIDADDLKRLEPVQARYNGQVLQAFKGNEPLRALMETDLKAINEITDPARKRGMIAAYQKKYGAQYKSVLAAGKVDLNAVAREMSVAAPHFRFALRDGLTITAVPVETPPATLKTQSASASPPTLSPTEVRVLTGPDYTFAKERSCSNIAGGEVVRSGGYMRAEASSIVGGGCTSDGVMSYEFTVAERQQVEVALTFNLSSETFAVGVVGSAFSSAGTSVRVEELDARGEPDGVADGLSASIHCSSFAGMLMADSDECAIEGVRKTATITTPGRYRLTANARSNGMAIIAGSTGKAELHQLRATLTFRPN